MNHDPDLSNDADAAKAPVDGRAWLGHGLPSTADTTVGQRSSPGPGANGVAGWCRPRLVQAVLGIVMLVASACSVDATAVVGRYGQSGSVAGGELEALGPVPHLTHWHAAYIVRICDQVLEPFDADEGAGGIHSHGDGLIHVHPYDVANGYDRATIGVFADSVGLGLATGELTLPGGGTWRDGDLCDGVPGRVFVDRWEGPGPDSRVHRAFDDPAGLRFEADREAFQIAFAPADTAPVVPPGFDLLDTVSAPLPDQGLNFNSLKIEGEIVLWPVDSASAAPCGPSEVQSVPQEGVAPTCFGRAAEPTAAGDALLSAQAVLHNREPVVDVEVAPQFAGWLRGQRMDPATIADPKVVAFEADGHVVATAMVTWPVAGTGDRFLVDENFGVAGAVDFAERLSGSPDR